MAKILVTGGLGFIGSNFINMWAERHPEDFIVNVDKIGYASNKAFIHNTEHDKYFLDGGNLSDPFITEQIFAYHRPDMVFHFAAESHVCNSLADPSEFFQSNALGTFNLLEAARKANFKGRIILVSTDEVYGELGHEGKFSEVTPLAPRSPYSTSKACADLYGKCYNIAFGLDVIITNCSNNFGPHQHDEKLIPKTIKNILSGVPVTLYQSGKQVRDWLHVEDHCEALMLLARKGVAGETYCIGGQTEKTNIEVVDAVYNLLEKATDTIYTKQIVHTLDRPSDDFRYAIDTTKIEALGWSPNPSRFNYRLLDTIGWYVRYFRDGTVV